MKLALYLPNFRNHVTVKELEDLTDLAEELDFDSVWTLDRVIVPEASDRGEMKHPFGMMEQFPLQMPVAARGKWFQGWPLLPWLAARTSKVRIGMSITDTPYRSPGVFAAECATIDHLSGGRLNVGLGAGWMPEEFAAASATHLFPRRHAHVRETIEICQGIWQNETFEYHGEFADFESAGFGHQPLQKPFPPIYFSGLKDAKRSAKRIDDLDMCSMIWFTITDTEVDQTDNRKLTNILVGTESQITERLKSYKEAGLTMPLLWPPFSDVPVSKTLDDLKRLKNDIMPKVDAS